MNAGQTPLQQQVAGWVTAYQGDTLGVLAEARRAGLSPRDVDAIAESIGLSRVIVDGARRFLTSTELEAAANALRAKSAPAVAAPTRPASPALAQPPSRATGELRAALAPAAAESESDVVARVLAAGRAAGVRISPDQSRSTTAAPAERPGTTVEASAAATEEKVVQRILRAGRDSGMLRTQTTNNEE